MPESNQKNNQRQPLVQYASRILSARPYFRSQLRDKLYARAESLGFSEPGDTIDSILQDLAQSGYLDDQYLADAYVRRQLSKYYGPKIIAFKLKRLGLGSDQISQSLRSEATLEAEIASIQKYRAKNPRLDPRKFTSKLYLRGYSGQSIQKAFDSEWLED